MPAGITTCSGLGAGSRIGEGSGLSNFSLDRQIVQQIRERFRVHQAMLDRDLQQSSVGNLSNR